MKDKEATCVVSLLHQVFSFIDLAKIELLQQYLSDIGGEVGKSEVRSERIRDNFLVLRLFLPENIGEFLIDNFLSVILQGSQFPNFPPLIIIPFLGGSLLSGQFKVAESTEQPDLVPIDFFHKCV